MAVEAVIGDKAYSSKENIDAAKDGNYELVARLNSIVTQGNRTKPDEFEFNKDAGMYQGKAGHLAIHTYLVTVQRGHLLVWLKPHIFPPSEPLPYLDKRKTEGKNPQMIYFLDVEKCKRCPYREGCYKAGANKNTEINQKDFSLVDFCVFIHTQNRKEEKKLERKNNRHRQPKEWWQTTTCVNLGKGLAQEGKVITDTPLEHKEGIESIDCLCILVLESFILGRRGTSKGCWWCRRIY